jgi:L-ribulose-5-phosphate 3-epimerase
MEYEEKLGIMQGRLLPKYKGRYQAHPIDYWEDEFPIAADMGLAFIEFIFDYNDIERNPLMDSKGLQRIVTLSERYGVQVKTVCADYFMEYPVFSDVPEIRDRSREVLKKLISQCSLIGVTDIVIPCVDASSLLTEKMKHDFVEFINTLKDGIEEKDINLSLETDLNPVAFSKLLSDIGSRNVTVNYDAGNSASWGYDIHSEFSEYGDRISDIHIKDRIFGGGSVVLGQGDVDFDCLLKEMEYINYKGPVIFQAYRDDEGLEIFKKQLEWYKSLLQK